MTHDQFIRLLFGFGLLVIGFLPGLAINIKRFVRLEVEQVKFEEPATEYIVHFVDGRADAHHRATDTVIRDRFLFFIDRFGWDVAGYQTEHVQSFTATTGTRS